MKAEIVAPKGFRIAPEGHTVVTFKNGDIVDGWIAEIAISAGYAKRVDEIAESLDWKTDRAPQLAERNELKRPRGRPRKVQA